MYLLNLTFLQFAGLFASVSLVALALYLFDRSRRRQIVSTLRFWTVAGQPASAARRRRIHQPWSLLLQLLGMALLLLAIGELRFGHRAPVGRDHILILDTSAWMGAHSAGGRALIEAARTRAEQYIRALPARDRVMLVRADALATPATAFESDRAKLRAAIEASRPGATALNLRQALAFASHMESQQGRVSGEIAYIGAGRAATPADLPEGRCAGFPGPPCRGFRTILVPGPASNTGIRRVGARRSPADPALWEINVSAHNYGRAPSTVTVALEFQAAPMWGGPPGLPSGTDQSSDPEKADHEARPNGSPATDAPPSAAGARRLTLPPDSDADAAFQYRAAGPGALRVILTPRDAFPDDDAAQLELPAAPVLRVTVYSEQPDLFEPVFSSDPRIEAVYRHPSEYRSDDPGLVVLDRFAPSVRPVSDSLWIDPPAVGSPIPVRFAVDDAKVVRWDARHPIAAGLRTKDLALDHASVFEAAPDDARIGEVEAGPVIVARAGKPKIVVFGFHPELSHMRFELATPLLFANVRRWVAPEVFRRSEIAAGSAGSAEFQLDEDAAPADINVTAGPPHGPFSPLPFTLKDRVLRFFAGAPGVVRIAALDREYVWSLTLPEAGDSLWQPPSGLATGIPRPAPFEEAAADPWPWLAMAGAALMFLEWRLFARSRRAGPVPAPIRRRNPARRPEVHA